MSLIGSLNLGKSALAVNQAAIQVAGNNVSNAGNADYTRQVAGLSSGRDRMVQQGVFVGTGVNLDSITRQIDEALQQRIRGSASDAESASTTEQWLGRVEAIFNELSDDDLSSRLSTFFNSWSNLANKPQDVGLRQVVVQNGQSLANWIKNVRNQVGSLVNDVDSRLSALTLDADALADQIADLNGQITIAEGGTGGVANGLRDNRDAVLKKLSSLVDVHTIADGSSLNVYIGSETLVIGTDNRGLKLHTETEDGQINSEVQFKSNDGTASVTSGQIGALDNVRQQIGSVSDQLDSLAGSLIFELNKIHSSGQGLSGVHSVTSSNSVDNILSALTSDETNLPFAPKNGSFVVHVKNINTGLQTSTLVQVDLDGLNGVDTDLTSLTASLNGISDITASITTGGALKVVTNTNDVELSFSQDSSGVLAALGINTFFKGKNARDIEVQSHIIARPSLLAAAMNGQTGDNQSALAIAALESASITALDGNTLKSSYESMINGIATQAADAKTNSEATKVVNETLQAQREALSGVSMDEEAINLMKFQRGYQGAAKLITVVNEMMDTLMAMAR